MLLADTAVRDTTVQVAAISTIGLVVVALIGFFTAKVTSGARKDAKKNADSASASAELAKDYAAAAGAKDAALAAKESLITSMDQRIKFLEDADKKCNDRLEHLEENLRLREEEDIEQKRAASQLERDYGTEIANLRRELDEIKASK